MMTVCTRCQSASSLGHSVWYVEQWPNKHLVMQEVLMLRWRCVVEGSEAMGSLSAPTTNPARHAGGGLHGLIGALLHGGS
jgi:hypothetical protein